MTCIVGLVEKGTVYIAADSANVAGWTVRAGAGRLPKVFRNGEFLIGTCGSPRMSQLLRFQLKVNLPREEQSDLDYIVNTFVEAVRKLFKDQGLAEVDKNVEHGGFFLLGYRGQLYQIESDYQVCQHAEGYEALGIGDEYALGALFTLRDSGLSPKDKLVMALSAAEHFSGGVCAPFVVESLELNG